jgi:uncharacterized protein (DUF952 family)
VLIYKIVHAAEWEQAESTGAYHGSAKDKTDGFLHFSTAPQLAETLRRYYPGADDLLLVAVDDAVLGSALRYEYATSRGEDFPHLYGALPVSVAAWVKPIPRDNDGAHRVPT